VVPNSGNQAVPTWEILQKVDEQAHAAMNGSLVGFSPIEFQRIWPQAMKSAWRAIAMSDLGISPAIEGEVWRLPKSRRMLWRFKTDPNKLFSAYRSYDQATARAKSDFGIQRIGIAGFGFICQIREYWVPQSRRPSPAAAGRHESRDRPKTTV
jgi:hypothetical protein